MGGGGDLAQRKLFPALFDLYAQELLPENFRIVGLARTERSHEEYRTLVRDALQRNSEKYAPSVLDAFCEHIFYTAGSFDDIESYNRLLTNVRTFEQESASTANRLFYLAVPPVHYESIFKLLHESTLATVHTKDAWSRIRAVSSSFSAMKLGSASVST